MVRMLIADDSSAIQKVIRIAFAGFQVKSDEAFSFSQGLSWLGKASFDLIILDVNLPGLRGEDALREMKEKAQHSKFILLAGSYDDFNEEQYKRIGFNSFLRKPFDANGLISLVRSILGDKLSSIQDNAATEPPDAIKPSEAGHRDRTIELIDLGRKGRKAFDSPAPNSSAESTSSVNEQHERSEFAAANNPRNLSRTIKLSELDLGKKDFIVEADSLHNENYKLAIEIPREQDLPDIPLAANKKEPVFDLTKDNYKDKINWNELEEKISSLGSGIIRDELSSMIRQEIQKYFQEHFHNIARQVLTEEIRRLASDRQKFMDDV